MQSLRVGVIGLGFMGGRYSAIVRELPQAELVAVNDVRQDLGRSIAASTGAEYVADGLDLIARPDVEAVAVCTPEHDHVDYCMEAFRQGKAVLVEKPVADTVEAAERMTRAAREAGVTFMVGHTLRFSPCWTQAKERLDGGEIGEVKTIRTKRVGTIHDNKGWLEGRVSIPLFYGVHDLDVQRWFAGSEPASIYAQANSGILTQFGYHINDIYWAVIRFQNGVLGVAELGWHYPAGYAGERGPLVEVIGTRGSLAIHQSADVVIASESGAQALETRYAPQVYGLTKGVWQTQVEHFVNCVLAGEEPRMTGEAATEALRLSLAMEVSAKEGRVVEFAPGAD
jgi:predicted dehydrogenase